MNAKSRGYARFGGAAAAALVLAAGAGWYLGRTAGRPAAAELPAAAPAHTSGKGGTVVPYGEADAGHTLSVWLDPRCPYCAVVEKGLGKTFKELADKKTLRIEYHFATFLDGALGGKGSKRALNALGAAVNESPEKFMAYADALFAHQPDDEKDDTFGSTATLLELADQVHGLRTPAFNKAVKELTYMPWVEKVSSAFYKSGEKGTPVVKLDGRPLNVLSGDGTSSVTPAEFTELVGKAS
ncbi:DsbA family protein [Streptomyces sp. ET3-23]|uniref:DsbA family protein n=1 Tax=Streptomyces sp. ET3-23 TaxID=2885643 RepID=UPI001D101241|nr:thioredoxin domain-containing protein [Streptomyces sp. ET3-23]MCC2273898.1 DsbA family protein [Streptomyces sp. ET3-23]